MSLFSQLLLARQVHAILPSFQTGAETRRGSVTSLGPYKEPVTAEKSNGVSHVPG